MVIRAVYLAIWQRHLKRSVFLHVDSGSQFNSAGCQHFLARDRWLCRIRPVVITLIHVASEGVFGQISLGALSVRHVGFHDKARSGLFDYTVLHSSLGH